MKNVKQLKEERDKIVMGLEETYRRLVVFKKQKQSPMVVARNGKVVEVDPFKVTPTVTYRRAKT